MTMDHYHIQQNYPQPEGIVYLNTASSGLVSKSGIEQAHNFNKRLLAKGSKFVEEFYLRDIPQIRQTINRFIDVSDSELAIIPNFSHGLSAVIPSLAKLKRVMLYRDDYPSLTLPFELNPFEIFWFESRNGFHLDLNQIEDTIVRNRIDILAISHVQYLTGFTIDIISLASICKKHDVLFVLDVTQSLGAFPIHFNNLGINILITSNYKWMNSGYGTGILCIDEETLQRYPPTIGGFNSYKYIDGAWNFSPGIQSYEPGHLNMAGLAQLQDAINFKLKIGTENIGRHNQSLLKYFTDRLNSSYVEIVGDVSHTYRRNIIGINGGKQLEKYLIDQGILVKMRRDIVRIAFHFYNTKEDVEKLLDVLHNYHPEK